MIQGIINRLSQNSFLLKGWSVILVSAMFTFVARGGDPIGFIFPCIPALFFLGLDGYFLRQERLFRALYDHVRKLPDEDVDFSMDGNKVNDKAGSWLSAIRSNTLLVFHGIIFVAIFSVF